MIHNGWIMLQHGDLRGAAAVFRRATARYPQSFSAYQNLTQVYKQQARWAEGATAAQRACTLDPNNFDMRESWANCLILAERAREALTVIDDGLRLFPDPASSFRLFMRKAAAYEQLGKTDEATNALAGALEFRLDDEEALERISFLTLRKGLRDRAEPYRQRLHDIEAQRLPDRLTDGLAAIWEKTNDIAVDPDAREWAWELADKSHWTRPKWEAAAAWGQEAFLLLRRWRQSAPESQLQQLNELVEPPDLSELSATAVDRGACFVVAAHLGPHAPVSDALGRGNWAYRTIGSANQACRHRDFLLPVTSNSAQTARTILAEIKNGSTIGLTADDPFARFYIPLRFLGRYVEVPAFVPKLIRMQRGASYWCCPRWQEGRIIIDLERLPDPCEEESAAEWSRRWFGTYLAKLADVMRGRPENLVLFGGIWGNVNQTVLRTRRKMPGRRAVADAAPDALTDRRPAHVL